MKLDSFFHYPKRTFVLFSVFRGENIFGLWAKPALVDYE